ncbi:TerC family protein [Labrys monachus]|uniref:Tellurite resistance protein TerC n=1 Tax=Labrys monachus TaxID=217067 RepID=A0ABU0FN86_9HYPH|nr:TerC family protein [Labrys monachus]MDQ0396073.1 tellurite resistance protein TerC [Labrys monachus]
MLDFLTYDVAGQPSWMWLGFLAFVLLLLVFDLNVVNRDDRELGVAQSLKLSALYIAIAMAFGAAIWWGLDDRPDGSNPAIDYFTGYFIEKSLSIDNVFVIALIFRYFGVPAALQYRALVWGILATIVLRGIMIGAGATIVQTYGWVLYLFAAFLIVTGVRMLFVSGETQAFQENWLVRFLRRHMRITAELHGSRFLVRQADPTSGRPVLYATPLLVALIVINVADIVFAVDSVPAILAVTTDTFIVYTANIMAILGLRALYFALAAMIDRFHYLKYALALVLVFIGAKIYWAHLVGKVDPALALGVTLAIIGGGVVVSLWKTRPVQPRGVAPAVLAPRRTPVDES